MSDIKPTIFPLSGLDRPSTDLAPSDGLIEELEHFMDTMGTVVAGSTVPVTDCLHHAAILQVDFENLGQDTQIQWLDQYTTAACEQPSLFVRVDGKMLSIHKECTCSKLAGS